ncbi:unnamed protein product [Staurois parvus]|uniref:Uncharacterized protein n=1 Tax=Staurois parvus TaxID=386267 RepID=A0ABN9FQR6_9NEOB|nr:unnamed protein product [Staurois parvus]
MIPPLPGGPMSCQSAPGAGLTINEHSGTAQGPRVSRGPHEMPLVSLWAFLGVV